MAKAKTRSSMQNHNWVWVKEVDLDIEMEQCADEGRQLGPLAAQGRTLKKNLRTPAGQAVARAWLAKTFKARESGAYAGQEPSDLEGIRQLRPEAPRALQADYSPRRMLDRIGGAWLGRCCGCYFGKPLEGIRRPALASLLKHHQTPWFYGRLRPSTPATGKKAGERWAWNIRHILKRRYMPEDDDTNYTTIGLAVVKAHGDGFRPFDVANFWLQNVPYLHTCTAERAAYRNLAAGLDPPESAIVGNPYREWIGAQIRADAFGYLAVGRPEKAADYAWRDASISHVKNGIYGEMWVAAMLAAAYVIDDDPRAVVLAGLNEVPLRCRLADAVRNIVQLHDRGFSAERVLADIHGRWDERKSHHWCHTISNAEIVAWALLWGGMDFGRTICLAVEACFDTDCNGATAGSVLGLMLGARRLPARWTRRLSDTLKTGVDGYQTVRISQIARETAELARALLRSG